MKKKILITGVSGFIGFHMARLLLEKDYKVFGIDNLFICDSSVFPTAGNANSSLTTSALACRLADYLTKR